MTKIADIKPNPFRHLERYPIRREKVEALKASISSTGFWDNIVARPTPNGPEIAYGHHRLIAARETLGDDAEVGLIMRELDDPTMLKIMAAENMQEWESAAEIDQETIRAVIEAYETGQLTDADLIPSRPESDGRGQNATNGPLSAHVIADFLGWGLNKVQSALRVLNAIDAGTVRESDTTGLRPSGAEKLVRATEAAVDVAVHRGVPEAKAKTIVRKIATGVANDVRREHIPSGAGAIGWEVARRLDTEVPPTPKEPMPSKVVNNLIADVNRFWEGNVTATVPPSSREAVARLIAANRNSPSLGGIARPLPIQLAEALRRMADKANKYADLITDEAAVEVTG